ncbi:MAG: tetratricopeptide repeat protein [Ferruginibacter sp.]|nr:tetratricopeptide repeat protein [Ferruginibacter sp.]
MKKQIFLISGSVFIAMALFFFGKTTSIKKNDKPNAQENAQKKLFDVQSFLTTSKANLSPENAILVSKLENNISRGDLLPQKIKANEALANFWKDSAKSFELFAFYTSETSKLVNSEKNLTFAAQLFLDNIRGEKDEAKLNWETTTAIDLFERAIKLNPNNDDLKIGLGSCYIFGKGRNGNPEETMQGIQELLAVVRKDSTNMKAHMVLGIGGLISGQYDKAITRLNKVVTAQPSNAEAIAYLADAYAATGNKTEAVKWYIKSKEIVNDEHYTQEVNERIKALK